MTRTFVFFTSLVFLAAARLCDLATTFHFNPSLNLEGNPVLLLFGGGRTSLLAAALIPSGAVVAGLFVFWLGQFLKLFERPTSLRAFIRKWFQRVVLDRHPFKAYLPGGSHSNEGLQAIRLFGVGLAWALIFGSFAAAYAWSAIWSRHSPEYKVAFSFFSVGRFSFLPAIIAFLGFLFGAALFFRSEFPASLGREETFVTARLINPGGQPVNSTEELEESEDLIEPPILPEVPIYKK